MSVVTNHRLAALCLMAGTFFLPFGYDVAFKVIFDLTGSYWTTTFVFYLISASFFGLSFYFTRCSDQVSHSDPPAL
jgi:hypothetical protein